MGDTDQGDEADNAAQDPPKPVHAVRQFVIGPGPKGKERQ